MTDQGAQVLATQIMSNPQLMAELQANARKPPTNARVVLRPEVRDQYRQPGSEEQILKKYGIDMPHDWVMHTDDNGQVSVRHLNWFQRNGDWMIPLTIVGGGIAAAAIPALIGGGAAAGGGAGGAAGGGAAATGGGTLASTTIGSGFVPSLVEGGTGLASLGGGAAAVGGGAAADAALTTGAALAPEAAAPAVAPAAAATVPEAGAITPTTLAGMPGAGTGGLASSPLATPAVATTLPAAPASSLGGDSAASLASSPSALSKYAGIASKLSPVLSQAAKDRASGLAQENVANYRLDTTALDRTKQNNQALLDEMKARIDSQNQYSKSQNQDTTSTERGDLLANVQDVVATHPRANIVHYSGGIRPSALGPNARAAGQMLSDNALANMRQPALTPPTLAMADPLTQKPNGGKTSLTDRLLSYGSLASGLSGLWRG